MAIPAGHRKNFETLVRAVKNGDAAILEVQEKATKNTRVAIVAVSRKGNECLIVPLALMFDGDPYAVLNPPDPKGGFIEHEK